MEKYTYDNPNYLIPPVCYDPFVYKQYRYFVDGKYAGELFFSYQVDCMFRSIESGAVSVQHGKWEYCSHIQAIMAFFDFEGSMQETKFKWRFIRGTEGIDYAGRQIIVIPNADWKWNTDETSIERCALPFHGDIPTGMPPGIWQAIHFQTPTDSTTLE